MTAPTEPRIGERIRRAASRGGPWYCALFVTRAAIDRTRDALDNRLASIERRKRIVEPWTISARRFTAADNRALYDNYDWSARGEEWTTSEAWKTQLIEKCLLPNVPEDSTVVEIGPGGGRWTDLLRHRARKVYVVDVAERSLSLCRERFQDSTNIDYLLSNGRTIAVPDASADAVWSYDVFVHINPLDAQNYVRELQRVMKPGAKAVIHHPGDQRVNITRSDLTNAMMRDFCETSGLRVVSQTQEFNSPQSPTDFISVIEKPADRSLSQSTGR